MEEEKLCYTVFFFFFFSKLFLVSNAEKILRIWLDIDVESVVSGEIKELILKGDGVNKSDRMAIMRLMSV